MMMAGLSASSYNIIHAIRRRSSSPSGTRSASKFTASSASPTGRGGLGRFALLFACLGRGPASARTDRGRLGSGS